MHKCTEHSSIQFGGIIYYCKWIHQHKTRLVHAYRILASLAMVIVYTLMWCVILYLLLFRLATTKWLYTANAAWLHRMESIDQLHGKSELTTVLNTTRYFTRRKESSREGDVERETRENTKMWQNKIRFSKFEIYAKEFGFFFLSIRCSVYRWQRHLDAHYNNNVEACTAKLQWDSAITNDKISSTYFGGLRMCLSFIVMPRLCLYATGRVMLERLIVVWSVFYCVWFHICIHSHPNVFDRLISAANRPIGFLICRQQTQHVVVFQFFNILFVITFLDSVFLVARNK